MALLDPRERLLKRGARSLSNEELLAVLLRNGGSVATAMEATTEILSTARGFQCLLEADVKKIGKCVNTGFKLDRFTGLDWTLGYTDCLLVKLPKAS